MRTPYISTTTGFGHRKNKNMAGVYHSVVCMQTVSKYRSLYIHHDGGAARPPGVGYRKCCISTKFLHIHKKMVYTSHFRIFLGPNPVVVYIYVWCPHIIHLFIYYISLRCCPSFFIVCVVIMGNEGAQHVTNTYDSSKSAQDDSKGVPYRLPREATKDCPGRQNKV